MGIKVVNPSIEIIWPKKLGTLEQYLDAQLDVIEQAGRTCYKTEHLITGDKEKRDKFIAGIIKRGHESVIEHSSLTVRFIGSRAMSHQLVRHRLAGISQESQRYCNYTGERFGDLQVIKPLSIPKYIPSNDVGDHQDVKNLEKFYAENAWHDSMRASFDTYNGLVKGGVKPEDARFVLPNACKTEVVMTANFREWRYIFKMRCDIHAQWEIRALCCALLRKLQCYINPLLGDFNLALPNVHVRWVKSSDDAASSYIIATEESQIPYLVKE